MSSTDTPQPARSCAPPTDLARHAHVAGPAAYSALVADAEDEADHEAFWARQARELLSWK